MKILEVSYGRIKSGYINISTILSNPNKICRERERERVNNRARILLAKPFREHLRKHQVLFSTNASLITFQNKRINLLKSS
jgi:hypothetical protein